MIPLYVEIGALGHVNTTWGMISQMMGMTSFESKRLRLRINCCRIQFRNGIDSADAITSSIPDETAIPSDSPIMICTERSNFAYRTNNIEGHLEQTQNTRERGWVAIPHWNLFVTICERHAKLTAKLQVVLSHRVP